MDITRQETPGIMDTQAIFQIITQHTRQVVPGLDDHSFKHSDSLRELGANSIDRSEILMMTLESLALNVPLLAFSRAQNIGEVAAILHEKMQPA